MSLFGTLFSWLSTPPGGPGPLVVDGPALAAAMGRSRKLSPRDLLTLLDRLAALSDQEGMSIMAVFEGQPLRKVADGEDHKGVTVYYAEDADEKVKKLIRLARKSQAIVITSEPEIEVKAQKVGARVLRTSTLKKLLEGGNDNGGPRRSSSRNRGPGNRPRRRPRNKPSDDTSGGNRSEQQDGETKVREPREPREPRAPREPKEPRDPVRDLIDLVE